MDVARYGDYATLAYTNAKVQENYRRRFRITFPNEELPGGAAAADDADPRPTDRRERGVGRDVRPGARALVPGGGSRAARGGHLPPLERLGAGRRGGRRRPRAGRDDRDLELREVPGQRTGRRGLAVVAAHGPHAGAGPDHADRDAQRGRADRRRVHGRTGRARRRSTYLFGSMPAEVHHSRWFRHHLPADGSVRFEVLGLGLVGLSVAGPRSRDVLAAIAPDLDLSTEAFPFMTFRRVDLGMTPVHLARINYAGDLGYELWVAPEYQRELFDRIVAAGEPHGLRLFGMRALMSLRLEKSYGTWFREYRPIYTPLEAGITRYIRLDHEFIGRAAHEAEVAARRPGAPARRVRRGARSRRSGRCHRRRADLARRRGRRLGDVGRLRPPRRAVDGARLRAGGPRDAGRAGRRRGSRSRSSAGDGRRGSSPSRCSTRRACGCASDASAIGAATPAPGGPDRRRRPPGRVRGGRQVADRDPAGGGAAGSRRDAVPRRRLPELPRQRRRHRLRPDVPGRLPARVSRSNGTRTARCRHCPSSARRTWRGRRPAATSRSSGARSRWPSSVAGRAGWPPRPRPRRTGGDVLVLDAATATRSWPSTRAHDRRPAAAAACSTSTPTRSSSRPAPPRSSRSVRATTSRAS